MFDMPLNTGIVAKVADTDRAIGIKVQAANQMSDAALRGQRHRKAADAKPGDDADHRQPNLLRAVSHDTGIIHGLTLEADSHQQEICFTRSSLNFLDEKIRH